MKSIRRHIVENPDLNNAADFGIMDNLIYNHDAGNKLLSVTEQAGASIIYGFKDGNTSGNDYTYTDYVGNYIYEIPQGGTPILQFFSHSE